MTVGGKLPWRGTGPINRPFRPVMSLTRSRSLSPLLLSLALSVSLRVVAPSSWCSDRSRLIPAGGRSGLAGESAASAAVLPLGDGRELGEVPYPVHLSLFLLRTSRWSVDLISAAGFLSWLLFVRIVIVGGDVYFPVFLGFSASRLSASDFLTVPRRSAARVCGWFSLPVVVTIYLRRDLSLFVCFFSCLPPLVGLPIFCRCGWFSSWLVVGTIFLCRKSVFSLFVSQILGRSDGFLGEREQQRKRTIFDEPPLPCGVP